MPTRMPIKTPMQRLAASSQNPPTGDGAIVLDSVLARLSNDPYYQTVRDDLVARAEMGLEKYGTKLRINNGRSALVDQYQEVLDALMYAHQAALEGDYDGAQFFRDLLNIAVHLGHALDTAE